MYTFTIAVRVFCHIPFYMARPVIMPCVFCKNVSTEGAQWTQQTFSIYIIYALQFFTNKLFDVVDLCSIIYPRMPKSRHMYCLAKFLKFVYTAINMYGVWQ